MKLATVCSHTLWVPDNVADWDAVAEDSPWEKERIESILATLVYGDVLYDIGAEHGWMTAIYAKQVGGHNVVAVEPSDEFWPNIRQGFEMNGLQVPLACVVGFAGAEVDRCHIHSRSWPRCSEGEECGAMAYRHPNEHKSIGTTTIDAISAATGRPPRGITIDVEGAELGVIKGARLTLERDRPWVWVSIHPDLMIKDFGVQPGDLIEYMRGFDYYSKLLRVDHEEHHLFWPVERRVTG